MPQRLNILIVEDNPADAELLVRALRHADFEAKWRRVDTASDFRDALRDRPDLVLSDYEMPQFNGLRALQILRETGHEIPFILVSGTIGEDTAVLAMKQGAADYLLKDRLGRLGQAVNQAMDAARLREIGRQAEQAMRASELRFRSTLENLIEGCQIIGRDWRYLYVNEVAARHGRRPAAELTGRTMAEVYPGIEGTALFAMLAECMTTRTARGIENKFVYPDGTAAWFQLMVQPVPEGLFILSLDITDRKRADQNFRLFRELVDHSKDAFEVVDPDTGLFLDVNDRGCEALGYSRAELLQLGVGDIDPTVAAAGWPETVARIRATGEMSGEGRHVRKDGTSFPVEFNARWVCLDRDYIVTAVRDITERQRAAESLRASEERFRQVVENIREVFWMSDVAKNRILYVSPGYEEIWGRSCADLYVSSRAWLESIHPEDRERIVEAATQKQAAGSYDETYRIVRPDGALRWVRDRAFPVKDAAGVVSRIVGVAEDITGRKRLEEQFLRAQRLEAIGTLSSGIAHDLNNILAPMLMVSPLLREKLADPHDVELLDMVEQSARRGASVVKQLLTFSRGVDGDRGSVQVRHLLKEMAAIMRETFPRDITIVESIPSATHPVVADPTQLHQVLMNLCVNARDAMPEGGRLTLAAQDATLGEKEAQMTPEAKPGSYVVLSVADTGHGISRELVDRIFEPFFTTKEIGKGTGLGLSTVLGIVRSHRGFVTVYSEPGRGSSFRVYLPAAGDPAAAPGAAPLATAPGGRGEFILVVDDEKTIRDALRHVLELRGYRVITAANGKEGLEVFLENRNRVRLVITDLMMPAMGGVAFIRAVRQVEPGMRYIAMTGLADQSRQAELAALGVSEIVMKPCDAEELLRALRRQLAGSR